MSNYKSLTQEESRMQTSTDTLTHTIDTTSTSWIASIVYMYIVQAYPFNHNFILSKAIGWMQCYSVSFSISGDFIEIEREIFNGIAFFSKLSERQRGNFSVYYNSIVSKIVQSLWNFLVLSTLCIMVEESIEFNRKVNALVLMRNNQIDSIRFFWLL